MPKDTQHGADRSSRSVSKTHYQIRRGRKTAGRRRLRTQTKLSSVDPPPQANRSIVRPVIPLLNDGDLENEIVMHNMPI